MENVPQLELVQHTNQVQEINPPIDMLQYAISQNAGIETIERLMALQERNQERQSKRAFDEAISAAKAEMPIIIKSQAVSYSGTSYNHEDLADIAKAVDPILSKHGLSYRFRTSSDAEKSTITMFCILSHKDGYSEENSLTAKSDVSGGKNAIQAIGSAQTYLQRYTLKAALGLAAAKDNDARFADNSNLETISEEQVQRILDLVERTKTNIQTFCNHVKVASIPEIPAKQYKSIERTLLIKLEKASNNGK